MSKGSSPREALDLVRKLPGYARLVWALLRDPRVPLTSKGLLVLLAGYLINPIDIIPDFIPVLGQLDDVAVTLLVLDVFIRNAPPDVVAEHLARISRNEDELHEDLERTRRLLGGTFERIRDNLQRVLERSGKRFRSADEAASGLDEWEEREGGS